MVPDVASPFSFEVLELIGVITDGLAECPQSCHQLLLMPV